MPRFNAVMTNRVMGCQSLARASGRQWAPWRAFTCEQTATHALFDLSGGNLRNGVILCGRKCFWLRPLLVSWLVPPFPFKRPRQMPLGVAAIRPPRQGTLAITRRERRSSAGARVNGSCTKLPIGVALRRRPNLSKGQGDPRPARIPLSFSLSPRSFLPHCL